MYHYQCSSSSVTVTVSVHHTWLLSFIIEPHCTPLALATGNEAHCHRAQSQSAAAQRSHRAHNRTEKHFSTSNGSLKFTARAYYYRYSGRDPTGTGPHLCDSELLACMT